MFDDDWIDAAMGEPKPHDAWPYVAGAVIVILIWALSAIGVWTVAGWLS